MRWGISVIAASLPTIRPIFGKFLPERIIQSVRSIFSLESLSSSTFSGSRRATRSENTPITTAKNEQFSEDVSITQSRSKSSMGSIADRSAKLGDLEAQSHLDALPVSASRENA